MAAAAALLLLLSTAAASGAAPARGLAASTAGGSLKPPPQPPRLQRSFASTMWTRSIASGEGWRNSTGPVAVDATSQTVVQDASMTDGRVTHLLFRYHGDRAGVYSLQPFFEYRVCFLYPLPGVAQGRPETFEQALGVVWCPNGLTTNEGCVFETYNRSSYTGPAIVGGASCDVFEYAVSNPPATMQRNQFCVTAGGNMLSVNLSFTGQQKLNNDTFNNSAVSQNVFTHFMTPPPDAFQLPAVADCVDLRPMKRTTPPLGPASATADRPGTMMNSEGRIAQINADAAGRWSASQQGFNVNRTAKSAADDLLGLQMAALQLPLPSAAHLLGRGDGSAAGIPERFDARERWGASCPSIGTIRDQARCGACSEHSPCIKYGLSYHMMGLIASLWFKLGAGAAGPSGRPSPSQTGSASPVSRPAANPTHLAPRPTARSAQSS